MTTSFEYQESDGLDLFRNLPIIKRFIPPNTKQIQTLKPLRPQFIKMTLHLPASTVIGVKLENPVTYRDRILFGVLPLEKVGLEYLCSIDYFKTKCKGKMNVYIN